MAFGWSAITKARVIMRQGDVLVMTQAGLVMTAVANDARFLLCMRKSALVMAPVIHKQGIANVGACTSVRIVP